MAISAKIVLDTPYLREGVRYRYDGEFMMGRMKFVPTDPEARVDTWTPSEEQFERELAAKKLQELFILKDANGDVVTETTQIDLSPGAKSKKENRARSLFFFLKKWHRERAA